MPVSASCPPTEASRRSDLASSISIASRPRRERRQRVEQVVGGDERLFEPELKGAQRGLAEQQNPGTRGDGKGRPRGERVHNLAFVLAVRAERTADIRLQVVAEPPDDCALGTASPGRQPRDLVCGALHVEAGGERVSAEAQEVAGRKRRNALAVPTQTPQR